MRHRSSAVPLAIAWAALIVYASLYPFEGWRPARSPTDWGWLVLPWLRFYNQFDGISNLLGYMPMGGLLFLAVVRSGGSVRRGLVWAIVAGSLLSLSMEELQNFLPRRVPSRLDWMLNSAGAAIGALAALGLNHVGAVARWHAVRERWFIARSATALTLLLLWPVALLFPPPLPLGLGQVIVRVPELLQEAVAGTPWAAWFDGWSAAGPAPQGRLPQVAETIGVMLGLLAPCLLGYSISRPGWHRLALSGGAIALGLAATTLSIALNFGPEHALAWITPTAVAGFVLGAGAAVVFAWLPRRAAAGVGLMALTALVAVVVRAPLDAYYAESLQAWEQGRFIRFHGLAQWVGWAWPYATMLVLLGRLGTRDAD